MVSSKDETFGAPSAHRKLRIGQDGRASAETNAARLQASIGIHPVNPVHPVVSLWLASCLLVAAQAAVGWMQAKVLRGLPQSTGLLPNEHAFGHHEAGSARRGDPAGWPRRGASRHDTSGFIALSHNGSAFVRDLAITIGSSDH
jgi:hypothetical protein